ncbi:MAG: elongation factor G [Candidatus Glassbacteria bacterium]|nr:elongation factor G [Candidatus Glassbacteria bacterium]
MKNYDSEEIRNVAVIGHGSSGKTSLTGALCFAAGSTKRLGSVDEGNALTDYSQDEIDRKISINLSIAYAEYEKIKINLIDAPGYLDFIGDAYAALRGSDNALIVVHGVSGVEIGTNMMAAKTKEDKIPVAVFVNMMDKENADFDKVLGQLRGFFDGHVVPMTLPIGNGPGFKGVVDVRRRKACIGVAGTQKGEFKEEDIPADMAGRVEGMYREFIEDVAEQDEALMEKYFADEELTPQEIGAAMQKGILNREFIPVFCGSSTLTFGVPQLLDGIAHMMPDPTMFPPLEAKAGEEEVEVNRDSSAPMTALVFKTISETHVGEMSFFRVGSGVIKGGEEVLNANMDQVERLGHLNVMQGHDREEVDRLVAGDIGVVAKLKGTHTGNTLSSKQKPLTLADIEFPRPVMNVAIVPKTRGDEDKISSGLRKLQEEDRSFNSYFDGNLHQQIVWAMGELHLDVIKGRLERQFHVQAEYVKPRIPYKETIRKEAEGQGKFKKQSGGRGQYGDCWIRIKPLESGAGFEFHNKIVGGAIPGRFIPSVEKGLVEAANKGIQAGYPVDDFMAECYDGSYHNVDSSDVAFQVAGSIAFQSVAAKADPVIMEPIQDVEVLVPEDCMGDVIGDLNGRRGRIQGMTGEGAFQKVAAQVPQAEMYKYSTSLRSITGGRGTFKMDFSHYEAVPHEQTQKIIGEYKHQKEEDS